MDQERTKTELEKLRDSMPGEEGAFERFIASALATILTIIFSWQIILDLQESNEKKRKRKLLPPDNPRKRELLPTENPRKQANITADIGVTKTSSPSFHYNNDVDKTSDADTDTDIFTDAFTDIFSDTVTEAKQIAISNPSSIRESNANHNHNHSTKLTSNSIREYKLTPGTLSRLEAVPDPIEIFTHSASVSPISTGSHCVHTADTKTSTSRNLTQADCHVCCTPQHAVPNYYSRHTENSMSCDTTTHVNSTSTTTSCRTAVQKLQAFNSTEHEQRLLATPEDFDSVPLEDNTINNNSNSVNSVDISSSAAKTKKGKSPKMFDESWDMEDDFSEIYGDEDIDRTNPRNFFFMPLDQDSSDDDHYWPPRMLEAISEEDEADLSDTTDDDTASSEEFSDDSLVGEETCDKSKVVIIEDCIVVSQELVNGNQSLDKNTDNTSDISTKNILDFDDNRTESFTLDSDSDTVKSASRTDDASDSFYGNRISLFTPESPGCGDDSTDGSCQSSHMNFTFSSQRNYPGDLLLCTTGHEEDLSVFDRSIGSTSPISEGLRALCASREGLNNLEPSLSQRCDTGIVSRSYLTAHDKHSMDMSTHSNLHTQSPSCNGIVLNISNFDDSKLEYLDESYRDSDLSSCSQPAPRGFIFSETQDCNTENFVSTNVIPKFESSSVHIIDLPGVSPASEEKACRKPGLNNTSGPITNVSHAYVGNVADSQDRFLVTKLNGPQADDSCFHDNNISSSAGIVESHGSSSLNSSSGSFDKKDAVEKSDKLDKDSSNNGEVNTCDISVATSAGEFQFEPKSEICLFNKPFDRVRSLEKADSVEASSGDESSTTTGDTAIFNLGAQKEVTDDDVSEISEIDYDVINELQKVVTQSGSSNKHQVTDLDASDDESKSENSEKISDDEENSDSSAEFEINAPEPPQHLPPQRNLGVLDELEEEELSTSDSSNEEYEDAIDGQQKLSLKDLASSGSSSSAHSSPTEDVHVDTEYIEPLLEKHYMEESEVSLSHKVTTSPSKLSISPYFATEVKCDGPHSRTIVRRHRKYSNMDSFPEIGFFSKPDFQDTGVQTVRSYRQPTVCTIDPERYFRPFSVETTHFDITTEYNTGEIEVRRFADTGVQIRFDPLWDKSEQHLVLSPCTTPTRGSPVTVGEGKLAPKELVFQWPEVENDNVFSSDKSTIKHYARPVDQVRRNSFDKRERRPSYEAIEETDEIEHEKKLIEKKIDIVTTPNKVSITKRFSPVKVVERNKIFEKPLDTSPKKLSEKVVEDESRPEYFDADPLILGQTPAQKMRNSISEVQSSTEISTKIFDHFSPENSSDEDDQTQDIRPQHHKRRSRRRSKTPPSEQTRAFEVAVDSSDDDSANKPFVERVHIDESSDADDEDEPLISKRSTKEVNVSPLKFHTTSPDTSRIVDTSSPVRFSPTIPVRSASLSPLSPSALSARLSPRVSPLSSVSRISPSRISPVESIARARPTPSQRVKPMDFISSSKVKPTETKSRPLYDQFNRPTISQAMPTKTVTTTVVTAAVTAAVTSTTSTPRMQTALSVNLTATPARSKPLAMSQAKVNTSSQNKPIVPPRPDVKLVSPKKPEYKSALLEPFTVENKNISHLFPLPDKVPQADREKLQVAKNQYLQNQTDEKNEEERKRLLSRLLGTRDWSEREIPKPRSILKKTPKTFETRRTELLPVGYRPTSLDTPGLSKLCKSTENIKDRITQVVNRRKEEDRERSLSRSNSRTDLENKSATLPSNFGASSRAKSLDSLMDNKSLTLPRNSESTGMFRLVRSPSMCLNKSPLSFFSDRKSYTNLLETDIDNDRENAVPLIRETDLDMVSHTSSSRAQIRLRSKSETRESGRNVVKDVYNDDYLEKTRSMEQLSENKTVELSIYSGTPEVVTVPKDNSRLSKSLGQLDLPDWYVNAPRKPEDLDLGLICTKTPPSSNSTSFDQSRSFRTNTSFDTPRSTVISRRVTPPRRSPSPKPQPKDFELPSERFRRNYVPLASKKIISKMRPPGSKSMENLLTKEGSLSIVSELPQAPMQTDRLSRKEKEIPPQTESLGSGYRKPQLDHPSELSNYKEKILEPTFNSSAVVQLQNSHTAKHRPFVQPLEPPSSQNFVNDVLLDPLKLAVSMNSPAKLPLVAPLSEQNISGPLSVQTERTTLPKASEIKRSPALVETTIDAPSYTPPPVPPVKPELSLMTASEFRVEVDTPFVHKEPEEIPFVDDSPDNDDHINAFGVELPHAASTPVEEPKVITDTQLRLQAPRVQAATKPHQTKDFTTTPTHFYALNCIETDLDTSATLSPPRSKSPDTFHHPRKDSASYMRIAVDDLTSGSGSASEGFSSEKPPTPKRTTSLRSDGRAQPERVFTFDPPKVKVEQSKVEPSSPRTTMSFKPASPRITTFGPTETKPTSPRITTFGHTDTKPPSPRITTFGHTDTKPPSPRISTFGHTDTKPTSPRITTFGHTETKSTSPRITNFGATETEIDAEPTDPFIFAKPAPVLMSTFRSKETSIDSPVTAARVSPPKAGYNRQFIQNDKLDTISQIPRNSGKGMHAPVQALETSIDSPLIRRNDRHPPQRPSMEPPPIPNQGRYRQIETNIDGDVSKWKTNTPVSIPNQRAIPPVRQNFGVVLARKPSTSRETNIDADIVQQPTSPKSAFEQNLDRDSFRFNAPQSQSSPLNMSVESNSSVRLQLGRTVNRTRPETNVDDVLPANDRYAYNQQAGPLPPPRRETFKAPPVPYRAARPAVLPPMHNDSGPTVPPRTTSKRSIETDIDGDLTPRVLPRVVLARSVPESPRNSIAYRPSTSSRPGSIASHTGSESFCESDLDLDSFKRMAREDPLVSTSSPRESPLDARFNTFGTSVRIDHAQAINPSLSSGPPTPKGDESPHNSSLVEVLDGLLGMDSSHNSSKSNNSDDSFDTNRKRTISEAKFDIFNDINRKLDEQLTWIKCRNSRCGKIVPMKEARATYVSCTLCYCYYCSTDCQTKHYSRHEQRCTFLRVEASCKLVVRRFGTDDQLTHQASAIARTGYLSSGRGCVLVTLDSIAQCEQVIHSGRSGLKNAPVYYRIDEFDNEPKIADGTVDTCVDYNPNSHFVLNVAVSIHRRTLEIVKFSDQLKLCGIQNLQPRIAVNDRQPREQWFFSVQNKLREMGVDLRRQYPDVYNQIVQYVDRKLPFSTVTIYPIDSNTGRTFLCSISPDRPIDIRPMTWNKPQLGRPVVRNGGAVANQHVRPMVNAMAKETEL